MADLLFVEFKYPVGHPETFSFKTSFKEAVLSEVLGAFIQSQIGQGEDPSPARDLDFYTIRLELDVSTDTFRSSHNCGNKGLRDGILLDILSRLPNE